MHQDEYDRWIAPIEERMTGCVWRIIRSPDATADVIQEVLLHLTRKIHKVRRHPNPTALILRICANFAIDYLRRCTHPSLALEEFTYALADSRPIPSQRLELEEQRALIRHFVSQLPRREAEAITLYALEELNYFEVAQAMGCREGTVRVLVGRARQRFQKAFPDWREADHSEWISPTPPPSQAQKD